MGEPARKPENQRGTLNADFANTFLGAAVNVLKVQCNYQIDPSKPFLLKKGDSSAPSFDITAAIGLTSGNFTGAITLGFSAGAYLKIMGNMLGETFTKIDQDLSDGAGELLNIIFGQAKIDLNKKGFSIEKAIPTVSWGQNISTQIFASGPTIAIPFNSEFGQVHILIAIDT